jgi:long-subunit fatty acid transport protein
VLDTGIEELDGDAVVLTFGGTYRTTGGWQFDVGVSEDVEVDASPDVVFNIAARRGF